MVCSVALAVDGIVKAIQESRIKNAHAESVTVFSQEVLNQAGYSFDDLDAVAVSKGPGSYTGLRIGVSTAKGFCFAQDIPLISVNTLKAMAFGLQLQHNDDAYLYCPMIDARRMEVYVAIFNQKLETVTETKAEIIDENSFNDVLASNKMLFAGDGAEKCKTFLSQNNNALFIDDFFPSASFLSMLAEEKYQKELFEDVAYFEPFYLKDFVAGIPRVKGLR